MSLSKLPLSYCTNVHPGRTVAEVDAGLDRYTLEVARQFKAPLAAGLWLAEPVVRELLGRDGAVDQFARRLSDRGLTCHTLNAFPYGDFHSERVKEQVYLPDWSDPRRRKYTEDCATILAALLPADVDGSISTLPLGFKGFDRAPGFEDRCIAELIACAQSLAKIHSNTGKLIRLAIEPEPLCVLETTPEAVGFFQNLWSHAENAGALDAVRNHLGLCYDVCHQAVEFEDVATSIRALDQAGVRINKVHVSCAVQIDAPAQDAPARDALRQYIEPRYLHQTLAKLPDGTVARETDLDEAFLNQPGPRFASATAWRVHFHVPVNAERLGPLLTTRPALKQALAAVAQLNYAPHLEVETYTWEVLPGAGKIGLVEGLTQELAATRELLASVQA